MVEFTNVNNKLVTMADLPIKNMVKFRKNLENMLKEEFTFEKNTDRLSLYTIKITGIKEEGSTNILLPPINYNISVGPIEIEHNKRLKIEEHNKRLKIERYNPEVTDIFSYGIEEYIRRLAKITSDAADKSN
ncbi:MAG: hypothetical protein JSW73_05655 [Candidatus Woesearchaeota archaeon]|nr:MAG: hypothetical protein JSW73_05655 [Candidatus Woesearchaeota archaeon]